MKSEIKRATGLLVIEVVNSNPNGDPDRESDPRQRANGLGGNLSGFLQTETARSAGGSQCAVFPQSPRTVFAE